MTRALKTLIHVAARDLCLDAETRRDLQLTVTGKASLTDMTEADLEAVVEALKKRGFKPSGGARARRAAAPRGDLRLAHVLWGKLSKAGAVATPGAKGLNAFVRVRFGAAWGAEPIDVDSLRDARKIATLIEALKAMCARAGIEV
ncbi:MAG: regulatory protein GemA [Paracoccaceae bacterium]|nr:MAG: regulatory protein GemA [Paracoccaceae bacterium]